MTYYIVTYTTDQGWIGQITKYSEIEAEQTATGLMGVLMAHGTICEARIIDSTGKTLNQFEH